MNDLTRHLLRTRHAKYIAELRDLLRDRHECVRWDRDAIGNLVEGPRIHWTQSRCGRRDVARIRELCVLIDDMRAMADIAGVSLAGDMPLRDVLLPVRPCTWGQMRGVA